MANDEDEDDPTSSLSEFAAEFAAEEARRLAIRSLRAKRRDLLEVLSVPRPSCERTYFEDVLELCDIVRRLEK